MKKKVIISVCIIILVAAITGLIYAGTVLHGTEVNEDNHLVNLTFEELQKKIDNKESFILLISRTDCSHCIEYKPTLKRVLAKYDITAYELEIDKISKEDSIKLKSIANVDGTPHTIFIENGTEKNTSSRLAGTVSESKLTSRLKAMGYIKE